MLLLVLPGIGFVYLFARRLGALAPGRRWTVLALRTVIVLLVVLTLAEMELAWESDRLTVFYVLDHSDSISAAERDRALEFTRASAEEMGPRDYAGMVVFGERASLEQAPTQKWEPGAVQSAPLEANTDIAGGLRLALAAFPEFSQKRIVLFSDGNENSGDALEVARMARSNQVRIEVYPLQARREPEVLLSKIQVESSVGVGDPVHIRVLAETEEDTNARLLILQDGRVIADQEVSLDSGQEVNAFDLSVNLDEPGFHRFQARIEAPNDANPNNNQVYGYTHVAGEPTILYVDTEMEAADKLLAALSSENIRIDARAPEEIPSQLAELNLYDSIILSNVPMDRLSPEQMRAIERSAHEMGVGLVMIGGPDSFGAGGYLDTPIETALPVNMDISQKRILPKGALVVILHAVEIPQGNTIAKRIATEAVRVMGRRDEFGYITYDYGPNGDFWVVPLQECRNKRRIVQMIDQAATGDMPAFNPGLTMSHDALRKSSAMVKHVVILSDGDPQPWSRGVVQDMVDDGITISAYAINPHTPGGTGMMKGLADLGGGNYDNVRDYDKLPRIFIKEAKRVTRSLLIEEPFTPTVAGFSEILLGIDQGFPQLDGYVATEAKELADVPLLGKKKDPLLAHWRYGLGKTVAFTSEAKPRWARNWIAWGQFGQFWTQLVRWSMRSVENRDLQVEVATIDGNVGTIAVSALDEETGRPLSTLQIEGTVVGPAPEYETANIVLRQVQPGWYQATFDARHEGAYMATLQAAGMGETQVITTGMVLPYSLEYRNTAPNLGLLGRIARITGGEEITDPKQAFVHNLPITRQPEPLWAACMAAALLLFPLDIFFRRVMVSPGDVVRGAGKVYARVAAKLAAGRAARAPDERMAALREAKARATEPIAGSKLQDQVSAAAGRTAGEGEAIPALVPEEKPVLEPEPEKPAAEERFTSQLLDAKKRAASRMRRRKGNDDAG